jgi:hypothetical protein
MLDPCHEFVAAFRTTGDPAKERRDNKHDSNLFDAANGVCLKEGWCMGAGSVSKSIVGMHDRH